MTARRMALWCCLAAALWPAAARAAGNYDITPGGVRNVYAGYDAYLPLWAYYPSGTASLYLYFDGLDGVPNGVTASFYCTYARPCLTNPPRIGYQYDPFIFAIHVVAAADAAPGDYTMTLYTHDYDGNSHTTAVPLRVLPAPNPSLNAATYQPPIPGQAAWEQSMLSGGATYCNAGNKNQTFAFGYEGSVWYYDGARVFYQIADYTGQDMYRQCAENVASQYADYVNHTCGDSGCGPIPAWRVFPRGLRMAYERTGQDKYRQAVENLAANGRQTVIPGAMDQALIRETSYALDSMIEAKLINSPNFASAYAPKAAILVDELIGMFEQEFETHIYNVHQPFMDGLAAEALISYYIYVAPDARIPAAIKQMLDWTWNSGWEAKNRQLPYQSDGVPWNPANDLIGLVAPAFGWYYSVTGDITYLQRGDELFNHVVELGFSSGKQFSQAYRWTFDYVNWRKGTTPALKISMPEHVSASGGAAVGVTLPYPAAGKCGTAIQVTDEEGEALLDSIQVKKGQVSGGGRLRPRTGGEAAPITIEAKTGSRCAAVASLQGRAAAVVGPDHLDVVLNAPQVSGGIFPNNRVTVDAAVPSSGLTVTLSSNRPDLVRFYGPDGAATTSVNVAAGSGISDFFYIDTGYVTAPTTVTITAAAGSLAGSNTLIINPPLPRIAVQAGTWVVPGFALPLNQVVLDGPAPAGGTAVSVWSTDTSLMPSPFTVTVPEGQIAAFFTLPVTNAASTSEGQILMSYGTGKYMRADMLTGARQLVFGGVPAAMRPGQSASATLAFNDWTPASANVTLTSSDAAVTVPAGVTVPRSPNVHSALKASFPISVGAVDSARTVTITATSPSGISATANISVTP